MSALCMVFLSNYHMCCDDTYTIIFNCDVAFTYRHVCMLGHSYILYISYINWLYTMPIQFHYIHMLYSMVEFSIIIYIYRRDLHVYSFHNEYHYLHLFISISIISTFLFLFYFHVSSLYYYYYSMDGLLSTWPVSMVNWRLYVLYWNLELRRRLKMR